MTLALFIVCLILAGVSYYFGYRHPGQSVAKWRTRVGFYAFAVLSILLAVALWQESRAADGLARHIPPYPAINGVTWVPHISNSGH